MPDVPQIPFDLIGGYGKSRQGGVSTARAINIYITNKPGSDVPPAFLGTAGLDLRRTVAQTGGRGGFKYMGNIYTVIGQNFYKITSTFNLILLGTVLTSTGYVEITGNNANQVMVVDGGNGYIYNTITGVFSVISDPDFPVNPTTVTFMDSYFVTNSFGTRQWNLSNPNDGLSWDALQAQNMSYTQDTVQSLRVLKGLLWVMGERSIETWANPGTVTPLFPLVQNTNLRFQSGVAAPASVVQGLDTLTWLASNDQGTASVMFSTGGEPVPISDLYVDEAIQNYRAPQDGMGYLFRENGHNFYALNFTIENQSWLYDFTTGYWTEQQALNGDRHILSWVGNLNNINIGLGFDNGNVYELAQDFTNNAGEAIHRRRVCDVFMSNTLQMTRADAMLLDMETGFFEGSQNPLLFFTVSKDRGKSYGAPAELQMGKQGNYTNQIQVLNLGLTRDFTFAIDFYEDFQFVLRNAAIMAEVVGN